MKPVLLAHWYMCKEGIADVTQFTRTLPWDAMLREERDPGTKNRLLMASRLKMVCKTR
jgi:hypothetical protein